MRQSAMGSRGSPSPCRRAHVGDEVRGGARLSVEQVFEAEHGQKAEEGVDAVGVGRAHVCELSEELDLCW